LIAATISLGSVVLQAPFAAAQGETSLHEKGRCAIRGHCGKQSIFGGELPCPDNELAHQPEETARKKLVVLCGSKWEHGPVCCREEQVSVF
jgi:Niemann-Pick C1 protein